MQPDPFNVRHQAQRRPEPPPPAPQPRTAREKFIAFATRRAAELGIKPGYDA